MIKGIKGRGGLNYKEIIILVCFHTINVKTVTGFYVCANVEL